MSKSVTLTRDRHVGAVREFTRFYTAMLEVLDAGLLDSPYTLTESRVLFELGQRDTTDLVELRRDLRIDAGYMTRIADGLRAKGLVTRRRSTTDRRRQVLALTPAGLAAYRMLDDRSNHKVSELIDHLDRTRRDRLVRAMAEVRDLMDDTADDPPVIELRAPEAGDYGWVVARHGAVYAEEYGWDRTFEALVARIVADFAESHHPQREAAWIATVDGEPAGCVFCVAKDDETAQLRILLVEPSYRGLGLGRRLVDECIRFARGAGYRRMVLWTNDVLTSARRIYQAAGFRLVDEQPHHSFGQDLVGQHWALEL